MKVDHLTPVLNVSSVPESLAWFERLAGRGPNRVLDVYGWDGAYRHSLALPVEAPISIVKQGNRLYILDWTPAPVLLAVEFRLVATR